jgi:hypothetical protein
VGRGGCWYYEVKIVSLCRDDYVVVCSGNDMLHVLLYGCYDVI